MKITVRSAKQMLDVIKRKEPVEWMALRAFLISEGINEHRLDSGVESRHVSKSLYQLNITDAELYERIVSQLQSTDSSTRSGAALTQSSHQVKVSASLIHTFNAGSSDIDVRICGPEWPLPKPSKQYAFIIENLECFLKFRDTWLIATKYCGLTRDLPEFEFIWADGNAISNSLNAAFLEQFSEIHCLLDVDFGGLSIFRNLQQLLPKTKTFYLIPNDLEARLKSCKKRMPIEKRKKLQSFHGLSETVSTAINLIQKYEGAYIEQESYRAE